MAFMEFLLSDRSRIPDAGWLFRLAAARCRTIGAAIRELALDDERPSPNEMVATSSSTPACISSRASNCCPTWFRSRTAGSRRDHRRGQRHRSAHQLNFDARTLHRQGAAPERSLTAPRFLRRRCAPGSSPISAALKMALVDGRILPSRLCCRFVPAKAAAPRPGSGGCSRPLEFHFSQGWTISSRASLHCKNWRKHAEKKNPTSCGGHREIETLGLARVSGPIFIIGR